MIFPQDQLDLEGWETLASALTAGLAGFGGCMRWPELRMCVVRWDGLQGHVSIKVVKLALEKGELLLTKGCGDRTALSSRSGMSVISKSYSWQPLPVTRHATQDPEGWLSKEKFKGVTAMGRVVVSPMLVTSWVMSAMLVGMLVTDCWGAARLVGIKFWIELIAWLSTGESCDAASINEKGKVLPASENRL